VEGFDCWRLANLQVVAGRMPLQCGHVHYRLDRYTRRTEGRVPIRSMPERNNAVENRVSRYYIGEGVGSSLPKRMR
jgi:hypothetical protein